MKTFQSRSPQKVVYHNAKPALNVMVCQSAGFRRILTSFLTGYVQNKTKQNTCIFNNHISQSVSVKWSLVQKKQDTYFFSSLLPLSDGGFLKVVVRCTYLATDVLKP